MGSRVGYFRRDDIAAAPAPSNEAGWRTSEPNAPAITTSTTTAQPRFSC